MPFLADTFRPRLLPAIPWCIAASAGLIALLGFRGEPSRAATLGGGLFAACLLGYGLRMGQTSLFQPLRGSRAQRELQQFFSRSMDLLCIADSTGHFRHVSSAWTTLLGFSSRELRSQPFLSFVHPEDRETTMQAMDTLAQGEYLPAFVNRYRTRSGDYRWIQWSCTPLRNGELIYAIAHDITGARRAAEVARENEERFRVLSENAPGLMWTCLPDGRCDYVNQRWLEYTGIGESDQLGYGWLTRLHPEDRAIAKLAWDRAVENEAVFDAECRILDREGNSRWFKARATPLRNADGRVVKWFGAIIDIDELQRAGQARREGEELLRAVLDAIDDPVCLKDLEGQILLANPAWLHGVGMPADEVLGKTAGGYLPDPAMARAIGEDDRLALLTGKPRIREETAATSLGVRVFLSTKSPCVDSHGTTIGLVCVSRDITERQRSLEAIWRSEDRFRKLFESMHEGFALCEMIYDKENEPADFRFLAANPAFAEMTGLPEASLTGRRASEIIPGIEPFWIESYCRVVRTGQSERIENEMRALGKHFEVFAWRSEPGRFAVVFNDITERRRAEEELRENRERLSLAMESAALGTWDWDFASGEMVWSPRGVAMIRPGADSRMTYQRFLEVLHPADRKQVEAGIHEALENRSNFDAEARICWPDGGVHTVSLTGRGSYEGGAAPAARMSGLVHDITERKLAEEKLALMGLIVESSRDAIIGKDVDGGIRSWNRGAERIYGYTAEEAVGRNVAMLAPSGESESLAQILESFRQGKKLDDYEVERVRKDGERVWMSLTISPMMGPGNVVTGACSIGRDVTAIKRAKAELERKAVELTRSNTELGLFASVASHDLQEPLRLIANYTQLLADRYRGKLDSDADDFIAYVVDGCSRMQTLIRDLLAYSRVGRRGKSFQPVDCGRALERALSNLQVAIESNGATIANGPLPRVMADSGELTQVFQNLIANAIKFRSEAPPAIVIDAVRNGTEWLFSVRDNGIGIEPDYAERIFIMFQRLHGTDEYPGTGIGLALCRKIVERHGGTIRVDSRLGEGAAFFFTIPVADEKLLEEGGMRGPKTSD